MPRCVTIVPSVCHNPVCCYLNTVTLRTHQMTTGNGAESEFHFIDHHAMDEDHKVNSQAMRIHLDRLGGKYHYVDGPFNVARYLNYGIGATDSEFIVLASADLIFHPNWLQPLLEGLCRGREFFSMHPWSFSDYHTGLAYKRDQIVGSGVVPCDHPPGWIGVFRRSDNYRCDENIRFWEGDCDYWNRLKQMGRISGIHMGSRVDNIGSGISNWCDKRCYEGYAQHEDTERFRQKWRPV